MAGSAARKKKILHPLERAKTSRVITARHEVKGMPQSQNYLGDDEEFKFPTDDGGVLGNLGLFSKMSLGRKLEGQLEGVREHEIPIRIKEKKPAAQNRRKTARQKEEEGPLALAQIRQGQAPTLSHAYEASMEVERLARSSNLGQIPRKKDRASSDSYPQHDVDRKHLQHRRDSTHSKGRPQPKSHHSQSDKPAGQSRMQELGNTFKKFTSSATTALKNTFSSPSSKGSSSSSSSKKRDLAAMNTPARKVEEVVDLCSDDDGVQNDHDENDGVSTATERSEVASSCLSTSAGSGDTSSASMVASAAAASAMRNSQDSYLSIEEMDRLSASAQGQSRTRERFALKEFDDLIPVDSPVEETGINVCSMLEDISYEPYDALLRGDSRLSTTLKSPSRTDDSDLCSSGKKARTEATPNVQLAVNWGGSSLRKHPNTSGVIKLGLTKTNGTHKRKNRNSPATSIVPGASFQQTCPTNEDPIEDITVDEDWPQHKRLRKGTPQRSAGVHPSTFHAKSGPINMRSAHRRKAKEKTKVYEELSDNENSCYTYDDIMSLVEYGRSQARDAPGGKSVLKEVDAVRIAIGKKVFSTRCKLKFSSLSSTGTRPGYLTLSYDKGAFSTADHKINLDYESVQEMKYYLADEEEDPSGTIAIDFDESEQLSFLAMQIVPNEDNGLSKFTNAYVPSPKRGDDSDSKVNKRYIAIEFRSNNEFRDFLKVIKEDEFLKAFVTEESKLTAADADEYGRTLLEAARKERKNRENSIGSPRIRKTRSSRLGAKASNEVMVVFPFGAGEVETDRAAEGLNELHSTSISWAVVPVGEDAKAIFKTSDDEEGTGPNSSDDAEKSENDKVDSNEKTKSRAHFLTIREEDNERLQPGEFLNDTLIDFWMQWIWRKEKHLEGCPVHFFTSHFYTALGEDGPKAVTSWTARKNIDVFTKKFIFIPVNQSLHWSLCVVVNPGAILNNVKALNEAPADDELYPCILFFDSLKAHRKQVVARNVRKWLTSEWKRLKKAKSQDEEDPFTFYSLQVHDPRVPYQDNSWDCGVFVCRYAHAVYSMRDCIITFRDARGGNGVRPFQQAITDSEAFDFGRKDIVRIRGELGVLIGRLSTMYRTWKEASDQAEKKDKKEASKKHAACRRLLEEGPPDNADDGKATAAKEHEGVEKPSARRQLISQEEDDKFADALEEMPDDGSTLI